MTKVVKCGIIKYKVEKNSKLKGGIRMVTIYLRKDESDFVELKDRIVIVNDAWFNLNWTKYDFSSDESKRIIRNIDNTEYREDCPGYVRSQFNNDAIVEVTKLSTGCKTALNILNDKERIFNLAECGKNAITEIVKTDSGLAIIHHFIIVDMWLNAKIKFVTNDKREVVVDNGSDATKFLYEYWEK